MSKYKQVFHDYFEQQVYEQLRYLGRNKNQAVKEVAQRFKEYDEGKPLSIFIK